MRKTLTAAAALAAAGLLLTACGTSPNAQSDASGEDGAPSELVFAVVPTDDSEALQESYMPVIAAIEEATGIPTSIEAVSSNAGVIEAQVAERVDIAAYGAFSYYLASDVADVTVVAKDQQTPEPGSGAVQSVAAVVPGSDIASFEDIAGHDVCFTDAASSTGYLAAAAALIEAGIDPENDINPLFVGGHDVAVTQMVAGDCDVAFVASNMLYNILPDRDVIAEGDTEVVWTSDDIPGTPIVLGNWLDDDLTQQITDAVLQYNAVTAAEAGLCDDAQREGPDAWGDDYAGEPACEWGGTGAFAFEAATDDDYQSIADICETTQAEVCRD